MQFTVCERAEGGDVERCGNPSTVIFGDALAIIRPESSVTPCRCLQSPLPPPFTVALETRGGHSRACGVTSQRNPQLQQVTSIPPLSLSLAIPGSFGPCCWEEKAPEVHWSRAAEIFSSSPQAEMARVRSRC